MEFPRPDGWQGGKTDEFHIVSGQRGFVPATRHESGREDHAELTAEEFDYRSEGA